MVPYRFFTVVMTAALSSNYPHCPRLPMLRDYLEVAHPHSPRNPLRHPRSRWSYWMLVHLIGRIGLRCEEAEILRRASLVTASDTSSGDTHMLSVERRHLSQVPETRQIALPPSVAALLGAYVSEFRPGNDPSDPLLADWREMPLHSGHNWYVFERFSAALRPSFQASLTEHSGEQPFFGPHGLRSLCVTIRCHQLRQAAASRRQAVGQAKALFGWSSDRLAEHHCEDAAVDAEVFAAWDHTFDLAARSSLEAGSSRN